MSEISNPHDRFFKEMFSRADVAEDFVMRYLPSVLSEAFVPKTFRLRKDSFVDESLREHFSDLLYEVDLRDGHGGFVFILFEHKSYPQNDIALQLFRYMAQIWGQEQKDGKSLLRPVIPLVLYHGRDKWNVPLNFASLYQAPDHLRDHLLDFTYHLCDLSAFSDEEIKGGAMAAVTLLLLKHIFSDDLPERLPDFFVLLRAINEQSTLTFLRTVLQYLGAVSDRVTNDHFRRAIKAALPQRGETHMNRLIEEFIAERRSELTREAMEAGIREGMEAGIREGVEAGKREGVEAGKKEGILEGRRQEAASLTIRQLTRKFGELDAFTQGRVRQLSLEDLEALGEELLGFSDCANLKGWLDTVR